MSVSSSQPPLFHSHTLSKELKSSSELINTHDSSELLENLPAPPSVKSFKEFQDWIFRCAKASPIKKVLDTPTPLQKAPNISKQFQNEVYMKREDCTPINSFKLRGSFTKISSILNEARERGVYACSAGNHAQGVAYSAQFYEIPSKIYMPNGAPSVKVDKVRSFGSEIVQTGETIDDCFAAANANQESRILIHPFDDPFIIGGNASAALELMTQIDLSTVDYIFCAIGGGGLISGVGTLVKKFYPKIKIIGVEATEATGMATSLSNRKLTTLDNIGKFADGAAIKTVGELTFAICQEVVDEVVIVSTAEICRAIADGFDDIRKVFEPAGALGIAGLENYIKANKIEGKKCIVLTTGTNIDFKLFRFISEMADTSERIISINLPEYPGSFKSFFGLVNKFELTGIAYNQSKASPCSNVTLSLRIYSYNEKQKFVKTLESSGYEPLEISGDPFAHYHGRFFTCGQHSIQETEVLYRFEFFNSSNKINKIFDELPANWDLTLVHYRNYGTEVCSLLIGIKIPAASNNELDMFKSEISSLGINVHNETHNPFISRLLTSW